LRNACSFAALRIVAIGFAPSAFAIWIAASPTRLFLFWGLRISEELLGSAGLACCIFSGWTISSIA
jgi:hypothetical protein